MGDMVSEIARQCGAYERGLKEVATRLASADRILVLSCAQFLAELTQESWPTGLPNE